MIKNTETTTSADYAKYLIDNQNSLKSFLLQLPYRLHLMSLRLGMTLDIGCGAGRNLKALNLNSIGIDHNAILVESCKLRGLQAYSTDDFLKNGSKYIACFDSILISHVAEHMSLNDFVVLLKEYKSFLKPAGVVVVICPQELGYASDSTHINFMDFKELEKALKASGFEVLRQYSYPFPRFFGKWFTQNEFVVNAKLT